MAKKSWEKALKISKAKQVLAFLKGTKGPVNKSSLKKSGQAIVEYVLISFVVIAGFGFLVNTFNTPLINFLNVIKTEMSDEAHALNGGKSIQNYYTNGSSPLPKAKINNGG